MAHFCSCWKADKKLFGLIAYVDAEERAIEKAWKKGLYVAAVLKGSFGSISILKNARPARFKIQLYPPPPFRMDSPCPSLLPLTPWRSCIVVILP